MDFFQINLIPSKIMMKFLFKKLLIMSSIFKTIQSE